jgi:hypothetical protein
MGYKYVIELLIEYKIFNLVFFNTLAIFFPSFFISYFYKKSLFYTCIFLFIIKYYFINIINSLKILYNEICVVG